MKHNLSTILLVEDEPEVRTELKKFLRRYSSEVLTASNGAEGLALFEKHQPDIVVSDIKMPKMNGIDMAKEIKKSVPNQVIIFTTAHSDSEYFLEAIEMQVDGYILKPVDLGLLKKKINDINKSIVVSKQNKLYENILDDIAQMQGSMIAVYDSNQVPVFYNRKLLAFLGYKAVDLCLEEQQSLSSRFEDNEECYSPKSTKNAFWVDEIIDIDPDKRMVAMRSNETMELKFFLVSLSDKVESKNIIVSFFEITSIVNKKRQYQSDAYTDELTQIANRARFNMLFTQALDKAHTDKSNLSIILMDIDNFKYINDTFGHTMGDTVLKKFSSLIVKNIRDTDSFARWGGEEFVLLLNNTNKEEAKSVAENLRSLVEQYDFNIKKQLTSSFGISMANDKDTNESLFLRVDKALARAKTSGKNKVVVDNI